MVDIFLFQADAIVCDLNLHIFFRLSEHHLHLAAVKCELEGIRQQVVHDLVEVDAVYPCQHMVLLVFEGEGDVALSGTILV